MFDALISSLPEKYELDYLVYSASNNLLEMDKVWNIEIDKIYLWNLFKKFDEWVKEKYLKSKESNG